MFLTFFFFIIIFLLSYCILVLLVLCYQIVHVTFCLRELHLIHSLPSIPMQKGLAPEHCSKLLTDPPEHLLN
ncbi:hypothetical protein MtrunA17_Chr3g0142741 [Medicago truncatula]|uniref:Transmembrane protein n=1 Tax=Medicago truncatula TaxID=3880 RepID=A0A396J783_MEDTR|nr:hypothetical protein MtrunA17_Chr3g0142741 [Medicago truncatula]